VVTSWKPLSWSCEMKFSTVPMGAR
jgi:hypothetical protein